MLPPTQTVPASVTRKPVVGPAYPPITFGAPQPAPGAAPVTPMSQLLAAINRPLNTQGIAQTAHGQALADTGSIVAALRGQQAADNQAAAQRASEINAASLGASRFLASLHLGQGLSDSLQQAAGDQASLASGFSGQLQQDVGAQGAKVSAALQAIGAPGGVPSTAAAAGNVVYGTGGLLPANAMLAAAPVLENQANQAPATLLGQGQQAAVGAIGAGKQQAAALDPKIAAAEGNLPTVEQKYVTQLTTAAQKSRQDAITNVSTAIKLQQAGDAAGATAAYRQAELSAKKAALAETKAAAATKVKEFNVTTSEKVAHDTALEKQGAARVAISQEDANTSRYRALHPASSTKGSLTDNEAAKLVSSWGTGKNSDIRVAARDSKGKPITNTLGVPQFSTQTQTGGTRTYQQAVSGLVALGKSRADATQIVNSDPSYQEGDNGRPFSPTTITSFVQHGISIGKTPAQIVAGAKQLGMPAGSIDKEITRAAAIYYKQHTPKVNRG